MIYADLKKRPQEHHLAPINVRVKEEVVSYIIHSWTACTVTTADMLGMGGRKERRAYPRRGKCDNGDRRGRRWQRQ